MNKQSTYHDVKLRPPYFNQGGGIQLHRHLVPEFVPQFLQQLSSNRFDDQELFAWQQSDRFSPHDNSLVLRLPTHKTFYLVSCEVVCNRLGQPSLDPGHISSAGYVIRRISNSKEYSWMLAADEATGWEESSTGLRDPDVHRRLCRDGTLLPREDVPTYTGEQTHPLHPQTVYDSQGKRHTVLYGYLPLGGNYIPRREQPEQTYDNTSLEDFKKTARELLPWPFGKRPPLNKSWQTRYTRPVNKGVPSSEFFELIRTLVNRYHLGEAGIEENQALRELAQNIYFYNVSTNLANEMLDRFDDATRGEYNLHRSVSLWHWLNANFSRDKNAIVGWIEEQEAKIVAVADPSLATYGKLPQSDGTGTTSHSLFITPSDAREFRSLLDQRILDSANALVNELPIAKFQQDKEDLYQVVPFLRMIDDNGKERIFWGGADTRSEPFRVAGPFDPNASRPTVIAMPSLKDLRGGLAKGVSMITPPDTFNLLNALNLKKGASEDVLPKDEPVQFGIQWICSFSLPVITLVAMIMLMIMISLLNILFFWLPWVKICLPFPKVK